MSARRARDDGRDSFPEVGVVFPSPRQPPRRRSYPISRTTVLY